MFPRALLVLTLTAACGLAQDPAKPQAVRAVRTFRTAGVDVVRSFAFSPDGKRAACGTFRNIHLWDLETGKEIARFETRGAADVLKEVNTLAFSKDGKLLVAACGDRTARVFDAANLKEISRFDGHAGPVTCAGFFRDGKEAFSAGADGVIRIWKVATGRQIRALEGHKGWIHTAVLSPDESQILSAGSLESFKQTSPLSGYPHAEDFEPRLWDVKTGKVIRRFEGHESTVLSAAFSPDGKHIVTCGKDRTIRLWDIGGKELQRFGGGMDVLVPFRKVAFSPDGKHLLAADFNYVRLFTADDLEQREFFEARGDFRTSDFAPDGRRFFTGTGEAVTLWEWVQR